MDSADTGQLSGAPTERHNTNEKLAILYRDEHMVAIHKPAGLLVHRSLIDQHETRFAVQLLRDQIGQRVYPVHRLDKPTSGVLLFALNKKVASLLSEQFAQQQVSKEYLAVVRGIPAESGTIDYPLKEQLDAIADRKADTSKPAQSAITEFRRLASVELPFPVGRYATSRYSLLALTPKTGRKHQLRRHMKHIFHPIVGDTTHGEGRHNRFFRQQFGCHRLLLTATKLTLLHPVSRATVQIVAKQSDDFMQAINTIGLTSSVDGA